MTRRSGSGNAGVDPDGAYPFDLADLALGRPSGTAASAMGIRSAADSMADELGGLGSARISDTASAVLKRSLAEVDPLQMAMDRAGLASGLASDRMLRDASVIGGAAGHLASMAIGGGMVDRAMAAAGGTLMDRTAREIAEAERRMTDMVLGRVVGGGKLSTLQKAEADAAGLASRHALTSGFTVSRALEDAYAKIGSATSRDHLFGYVTGVGSVARIAAGLGYPAGPVTARTEAMLLELQRSIGAGASRGSVDVALRAGYADLFPTMRSPRASEIEAVIAGLGSIATYDPHSDWAAQARMRLEAIRTPWVQSDLPDASITAMARLAELDRLVGSRRPFDADVVETLRDRFGDYREAPDIDPGDLADPIARTGYQLEQGYDPVLTVLPSAVLSVMFAPLDVSAPVEEADPDQIENAVRMLLKRLEHALRRFISGKLRDFYGEDWFGALPSDIRRSWSKGRERAVESGRKPEELIAYADIGDYRKIIEHPERWTNLFEPVFRDQGAIRETLRRIAVVRNDGAHFRSVTPEDFIVLRAEGVHLANWLGIRLGE